MKTDKIKVYLLEFVLLAILSFALFVPNIFNRNTTAILLLISSIVTTFLVKKKKVESIHSNKVTILLIIFAVIYLIAFYLMGLYFDYYKALVTFNINTLLNYIIPTAIIIISSEIIRNKLLGQNTKFTGLITFIIMVLADLLIYINIYTISGYDDVIEVIGFTLFASIACNLLYNYISNRYGIKGNIIYRLITVLYVYIIPYIPNVYVFFRAILRMVYPYIIYQVIGYTFETNKQIIAFEDKRKSLISKIILGIITIVIAMLISCQFKYGVLVIGSGSMTGAINKGDVILFKQFDGQEKIIEGKIIIFNKENQTKIVNRVIEVKNVNGEIRYTTKGDANDESDEGYITNNNIIGICNARLPYVGFPSIWMRDIFSN